MKIKQNINLIKSIREILLAFSSEAERMLVNGAFHAAEISDFFVGGAQLVTNEA